MKTREMKRIVVDRLRIDLGKKTGIYKERGDCRLKREIKKIIDERLKINFDKR